MAAKDITSGDVYNIFGKSDQIPTLETPFQQRKKRRAIATPPTFFIPRSKPKISPLTFKHPGIRGMRCFFISNFDYICIIVIQNKISFQYINYILAQGKFVTSTPLPKVACIGSTSQSSIPQKVNTDTTNNSIFKTPIAKHKKKSGTEIVNSNGKDKEVFLYKFRSIPEYFWG